MAISTCVNSTTYMFQCYQLPQCSKHVKLSLHIEVLRSHRQSNSDRMDGFSTMYTQYLTLHVKLLACTVYANVLYAV
jgi:hypothetical protein